MLFRLLIEPNSITQCVSMLNLSLQCLSKNIFLMMMMMIVSVSNIEKVDIKFVMESAPIKLNHTDTLALDLRPRISNLELTEIVLANMFLEC